MHAFAHNQNQHAGESYQQAFERFSLPEVARDYPADFNLSSRRDRAEQKAILKSLEHVQKGAAVLDLPCGTGRLTRLLVESGFNTTGSDSSHEMLSQARSNHLQRVYTGGVDIPEVQFKHADVMETGYVDHEFDAVICNRLFHHFSDSHTRRLAIAELSRISRGVVIMSFFNSFSVSAKWKKVRRVARGNIMVDRIPISRKQFEEDLESQGMRAVEWVAARWGRSPLWYVVAQHW